MKISLFFLFLTLLCCYTVSSQVTQPYGSLSNTQSVRDEFGIALKNGFQNAYTFSNRYKGVKGHPFLYDEWKTGVVCLKTDSLILNKASVKFKFDAYSNELWILNNTTSLIAYSSDIHWFTLDGIEYKHRFFKYPKIEESNPEKFYELIFDGENIKLVKDVKKVLTKANFVDKGMYSTGDPNDKFEEKYIFQFSFQNNDFQKIKLNAKSITQQFPRPLQAKLKIYCKTNSLSGNLTELQVVQILTYIESNM